MADEELVQIDGSVKSVVFHNKDNGYAVLHVEPVSSVHHRKSEEFTVVGKVEVVWEGEEIKAEGKWVIDKTHGRQFKATSITCAAPKTLKGIERYLGSGLIKGVGKVLAERVVKTFGEKTLHVLSHQSARLKEVPKLGQAKIEQIRKAWKSNENYRDNMIFAQTYGITISQMTKVIKRFGPDAIAIIKADPYRLSREIWGIGFLTADKIALSTGIDKNSPLRARASIIYTLEKEAEDNGNCWTLENDLLLKGNELTEVSVENLSQALTKEIESGRVIAEDFGGVRRIYPKSIYLHECRVVRNVKRILEAESSYSPINSEKAVEWWEAKTGFNLAQSQRRALITSLQSKFSIITGGPGVGKTTIIKALVDIFTAKKLSVILAAPTGRAAKRMTESVGMEAKTIHRLLKWNPGKGTFTYNEEEPCEADVFIFDETSMIDIHLAADTLDAIPSGATVVWVGDTDQLPSVGPGNVLGDFIASGIIPSTKLDFIFRQDSNGLIVRNAHHINAGENIETKNGDDFYFVLADEPENCLKKAVSLMVDRIPAKFGFNPLEDIQVLSPMRRGVLGTEMLNKELQTALNATGPSILKGAFEFKAGDRVMQLRNNYDKDVYNGDIGFIKSIDQGTRSMVVVFDGKPVVYESSELDELVLAYATTIHKSQGSEYAAAIVILHSQHYMMLQRNLLYTAITRGKKLVVLIGSHYAVDRAIKTNTVRERRTGLAERLAK
jgi:exodeoxyribonuclease V alpha subunit